jgi:uncharacterized ion transporter superfamily protein YfcC
VPSPVDFGGRVRELLLAPVNGMYGIQDAATGMISPFLFILSIGAFMTVVFATGALDLGIHPLAHRFRGRAALLIAILTLLFGVLASIKAGATRAWVSMASWFR